jgi:hypothetical protein
MAFVPNPDWGKLCFDFTWNGVGVSICLNFQKSSPTPTDFNSLAQEGADAFVADLLPHLIDSLTLNQTTVYDMASDSSPVYIASGGLPASGASATDSLPNNVAAVITHETNLRGRSGRGRTYMPGMSEANQTDGLFGGAYMVTLLTAFADFIMATEAGSGWVHVVASTQSDGADRVTALLTPTVAYATSNIVRSQRRRTRTS